MRASDRILRLSGAAGVIGIIALTAGCGGGGGSSAPGSGGIPAGLTTLAPGVTSTLPANGALLPYAPGDEWYYAVNGFRKTAAQQTTRIVRGSYLRSINDGSTVGMIPTFIVPNAPAGAPGTTSDAVATANGGETLTAISEQWNIAFDNNDQYEATLSTYVSPLVNSYLEWADDGYQNNLEEAGNDPCDDYGGSGYGFSCPIVPLTFGVGTAVSGGTSFNVPSANGSDIGSCTVKGQVTGQENRTFTVVGTAPLTLNEPAGSFQVWQVSSSEISSVNGDRENDTAYWAPQIGSFVQQQSTITHLDGSVDNFTYQLVAFKTVPSGVYSRVKKK